MTASGRYQIDLVRVASIIRDDASPERGCHTYEEAAAIFREMIPEGDEREYFLALFLDSRSTIKQAAVISIGCLDSSLVHPREVFRPAILAGASAIIVGHNHPSGDPTPSAEDRALTDRLSRGADLLGIRLLDHIILGSRGRMRSFRESGDIAR